MQDGTAQDEDARWFAIITFGTFGRRARVRRVHRTQEDAERAIVLWQEWAHANPLDPRPPNIRVLACRTRAEARTADISDARLPVVSFG